MKYTDRIYGEVELTEPVILDLIDTKALQRLKGIAQHVYFEQYMPGISYSRFEHSVGVMLLLRRFGATLEEQIAGLLHDASHTVFSHVGDFLFGSNETQGYQDSILETYIAGTDIPEILKKHQVSPGAVLDIRKFTLLEKPLPDLCADRIDYALREIFNNDLWSAGDINVFLNHLATSDGNWTIDNFEIARRFVYDFIKMNYDIWASPKAIIAFTKVVAMLQFALQKGYITKNDLFTTDREVIAKIKERSFTDMEMHRLLADLDIATPFELGAVKPDIITKTKSRAVDPLVGDTRYSALDPDYRKLLNKALEPIGYAIKLFA